MTLLPSISSDILSTWFHKYGHVWGYCSHLRGHGGLFPGLSSFPHFERDPHGPITDLGFKIRNHIYETVYLAGRNNGVKGLPDRVAPSHFSDSRFTGLKKRAEHVNSHLAESGQSHTLCEYPFQKERRYLV
jgi:hypothetical protein